MHYSNKLCPKYEQDLLLITDENQPRRRTFLDESSWINVPRGDGVLPEEGEHAG